MLTYLLSFVIINIYFLPATSSSPITFPIVHRPLLQSRPVQKSFTSQNKPVVVPLGGSVEKYAEFFVEVSLGTPPQPFFLQVDTGSTDLLVYGGNCTGCPAGVRTYVVTSSANSIPCKGNNNNIQCDPNECFNSTLCGFDDAYGDGSDVRGFVVIDKFNMGNLTTQAIFGSIEVSNTNFEPTGVEGIFGLAFPTTSSWGGVSPLYQVMSTNNLYPGFGMCLKTNGGSLIVGASPQTLNSTFYWTPLKTYKNNYIYYPISLSAMKLGSKTLSISQQGLNGQFGALVDSGTTFMILTNEAYSALQQAFVAICSSYDLPGVCNPDPGKSLFDGYCYQMSTTDLGHFPPFSVNAEGIPIDLTVTALDYLVVLQGEYYCLGIASSGGEPVTILGDTFMRNFYVMFDINNHKLGFSNQTNCP